MKGLYRSLARTGMKNNRDSVVPFAFATTGMIALFFILIALRLREEWSVLYGMDRVQAMLSICVFAVGLFSLVFLFYVGNHLMKARAKEYALYNILGLEKRHLARVLGWERLWLGLVTLGGGLAGGTLLFKLAEEILLRIVGVQIEVGFLPPVPAYIVTAVFFAAALFVLYLDGVRRIHTASPVQHLQESRAGERPPKVRWLVALLSLLFLGGGYTLALTVEKPLQAFQEFTTATLLVAVGTYLGFVALTVLILKLLQRKPNYYYRTKNFTAVSGLLYRMKANAIGLASVCLLSTMVLVLLSMSISLLAGQENIMRTRYPNGIAINAETMEPDAIQRIRDIVQEQLAKHGATQKSGWEISYASVVGGIEGGKMQTAFYTEENAEHRPERYRIRFFGQEDVNPYLSEPLALESGEAAVYTEAALFPMEFLQWKETSYAVKQTGGAFPMVEKEPAAITLRQNDAPPVYVVLKSREEVRRLYERYSTEKVANDENGLVSVYWKGMDLADAGSEKQFGMDLMQALAQEKSVYVEAREVERETTVILYGGMFFTGVFLGMVFLLATALIIYYKQLTEGLADRKRFSILKQVGMTKKEVQASIRTQVRVVFFLPLVVAAMHMAFAFPMLNKILVFFNLSNTRLFFLSALAVYICFALFYFATYAWTSRTYYRIVTK